MNHVSATDDSTLMQFPLSSCIASFHCQCCSNLLPPRLVSKERQYLCLHFWVCTAVCAYERHEGIHPYRQTIPHSTLLFSSSHYIFCETFQGVLVKLECSTCLRKVEGSRQEFQTATAANLGETCHCHLEGYMSRGECDLCQACR